jgi:hypothetical protein
MALASTLYKEVLIRIFGPCSPKRSAISIDGERLPCKQRAKSRPNLSSGGLVRIQFDSERDVLRTARCRRLFIPICGWDLATVIAEGSATMAVGEEDDPSQADER